MRPIVSTGLRWPVLRSIGLAYSWPTWACARSCSDRCECDDVVPNGTGLSGRTEHCCGREPGTLRPVLPPTPLALSLVRGCGRDSARAVADLRRDLMSNTTHCTPSLSDTHLVLLSAAAQHPNRTLVRPERVTTGVFTRAARQLLRRELVEEIGYSDEAGRGYRS
jgi:hypothetical protein